MYQANENQLPVLDEGTAGLRKYFLGRAVAIEDWLNQVGAGVGPDETYLEVVSDHALFWRDLADEVCLIDSDPDLFKQAQSKLRSLFTRYQATTEHYSDVEPNNKPPSPRAKHGQLVASIGNRIAYDIGIFKDLEDPWKKIQGLHTENRTADADHDLSGVAFENVAVKIGNGLSEVGYPTTVLPADRGIQRGLTVQ